MPEPPRARVAYSLRNAQHLSSVNQIRVRDNWIRIHDGLNRRAIVPRDPRERLGPLYRVIVTAGSRYRRWIWGRRGIWGRGRIRDSNQTDAERVVANLYKQVNVIQVADLSAAPMVSRDLALIKVKAGPERRAEVNSLAAIFRARIVDVAADSVIVEVTGTEEKIEGMIELLRPIGIMEMVRTGQVAMTRGAYEGERHTPGGQVMAGTTKKTSRV